MALKARITKLVEKHSQKHNSEAKMLEWINSLPPLENLFKPESQRSTQKEAGRTWTKLPTLPELFKSKEPGADESSEPKRAG